MPQSLKFDPDLLEEHFDRHASDFRSTSMEHYESLAAAYLEKPLRGNGVECKVCDTCSCMIYGPIHECNIDGARVRLDSTTDEFAVISRRGLISTYYRSSPEYHGGISNSKYFHIRCRPKAR